MKSLCNITTQLDPAARSTVAELDAHQLCELENAVIHRKLEFMTARLNQIGFCAAASFTLPDGETIPLTCVLVKCEGSQNPGQYATLAECRRLIDTVANLPPVQAFDRWITKIAPMDESLYTEQDAVRDMLEARAALKSNLDNGEIDSRLYADLYRTTSFMDLP